MCTRRKSASNTSATTTAPALNTKAIAGDRPEGSAETTAGGSIGIAGGVPSPTGSAEPGIPTKPAGNADIIDGGGGIGAAIMGAGTMGPGITEGGCAGAKRVISASTGTSTGAGVGRAAGRAGAGRAITSVDS